MPSKRGSRTQLRRPQSHHIDWQDLYRYSFLSLVSVYFCNMDMSDASSDRSWL